MKKCVMITGASRGIGAAIAEKFAKEGWNLVLTCVRSREKLQSLAQRLCQEHGISCLCFVGDMGCEADVKACFSEIQKTFGGLDALVNNAGISHVGLLTDLSLEEWNRVFQTNVTSVFLCSKEALPHMIHQKAGAILNISSVWGCTGASCEAAYSASKGAVNALTQALAKELAPSNISVNAIACGAIDTDMNSCFTEEEKNDIAEDIPAGRFGQPFEVAALAWSIVNQSHYLTGQIIRLDGGWI